MDWDNWKTRFEWKARFGQDSIKVFLGAAVISAIGLAGFAMLEPSERGEAPKQPQMFKGVKLSPWIGESELGPRTTFRVVFDKVVASADGVGKSAQLNPLVFEPELDGEFIWDSTRSGIFTPASGIPLDTKYTVTLQPDFAKAHDVLLHINYHTPPMRVQDSQLVSLRRDQSFFAGIAFNVAMDPSRVAPFVEFRAADGKAISAEIEPVTDKHAIWLSGPEPWAVRMLDETKEVAGHPTEIIIRPSQPLTPGMEWQLVLKQGLLSAAGHLLPEDTVCKLGKREPTKMERAVAHNRLNHGRSISIYFNRALAPDLSEQQLAKWLVLEKRIDSAPNKPHRFQRVALEFSTKISGSSLVLKGDFKLGVNYRVRVKRGLPTRLGLALAQNGSEDLVFKPLPGRIYLPGTLM